MKVDPFYSNLPGTEVYHDNDECTEGDNIQPENRTSGTGGLRLCDRCRELNEQGR